MSSIVLMQLFEGVLNRNKLICFLCIPGFLSDKNNVFKVFSPDPVRSLVENCALFVFH